ncbi:ATP-binding cassette domain-containing protein [Echinicola sp. CAU 1574]|uniref:ATP-binding cassette domain-containing protein n=1 Tax=Echinicola arenosa TaxID=2774144 RepID=A0ABR9AJS1_9BACT|nr:ATP-binding cassette domain-containing protein [Echinicola arenosa]MBD8489072.1 ATP-binding cassette domain-containing protein [Echinicola arenosa]
MTKLTPIQRLWRLLKLYKPEIRQIYTYALVIGIVNLSLPLGIQAIINYLQTGELSISWILLVTIVLVGITAAGLLQVLQLRIVENIQQDIFARSAFEFAFRLPQIKPRELDSQHAPELANRFFDTMTIQKGLPKLLIDLSVSSFQIIFGIILLSVYSIYFIALGLFLGFALFLLVKITGRIGLETSIKESKYKYNLAHWLEEIGRVRRTFHLSQNQSFHLNKSDDITVDYITSRESHFRVLLDQFKSFIGFKVFIAAGILVVGGLLVFNQQMNIGQFVAAEIVIILIINSVEKLVSVWDNVYDVLTAFEKIGFVTDMELQDSAGKSKINKNGPCSIKLKNATFHYSTDNEPIIDNFNSEIPIQSRVVLTGKTGSGKSTLLQILAGIINLDKGEISINDIPYDHLDRKSLHQNLGVVLASNQIFEGTLRENILVGRQISDEKLMGLMTKLEMNDFLKSNSKGLDLILDSGGRRTPRCIIQKIHLARAICHNPGLLLMEDPLVNIPKEERKSIIKFLTDKAHQWTLVVITDEDDWIANSTQIIKL